MSFARQRAHERRDSEEDSVVVDPRGAGQRDSRLKDFRQAFGRHVSPGVSSRVYPQLGIQAPDMPRPFSCRALPRSPFPPKIPSTFAETLCGPVPGNLYESNERPHSWLGRCVSAHKASDSLNRVSSHGSSTSVSSNADHSLLSQTVD